MARYTGFFIVNVSLEDLRPMMIDILESCNLEITYETPSSIIARENIGQVSVNQLVIGEIVFDTATSMIDETKMTVFIKNESLPLQSHNHCREIFEQVSQLIIDNRHWVLLESIAL
ncbi:hypothetical protein [Planktothrix paucivesiculata]|uniref:Uncharacterized protein n=1 Tax=Planktothrix paucivesiculata PCC 9631 TaxID=671071 RepID=A0A7Z9DX78_9CYAN|nr:hypothetical protein [Planktothrix paucivesiculata]VXD13931.1 conserved hypothetical protein [Planktothrix paucivesiculata PCC 9631]